MMRPNATLKAEEKAEPTRNVFAVGALVFLEQTAEQRLTLTKDPNEGPTKSAPKGKGVGSCQEDEQETSQSADHGDTAENDIVVDEFSENATGTMPPLPLAPLFKKTRTSKYTEMHHNDYRDGEESSFFDFWDEQSDIFQQADPWAQNALKSVSRAEGCLPVNFPVSSVCQKLGVYSQQLPTTAHQYDISSERESRLEEIPEEAAPEDNSNNEEW